MNEYSLQGWMKLLPHFISSESSVVVGGSLSPELIHVKSMSTRQQEKEKRKQVLLDNNFLSHSFSFRLDNRGREHNNRREHCFQQDIHWFHWIHWKLIHDGQLPQRHS